MMSLGVRWQWPAKPTSSQALFTKRHKRSQVCLARSGGEDGNFDGDNSRNDKAETGGSNKGNSNAVDQQQASWGSSWKRRSAGSGSTPPVSYFKKQPTDKTDHCRQQPTSSSDNSSQMPSIHKQPDPQLEASIKQNIDRAAETLQEIITEVLNEMLVEEASSYVMDEQGPALQINQAVRNAVVTRLEWLDSNFLATLNAYLAAPSVQGNKELSKLLRAVRDEVLDMVSARLPPAVQVLNSALQHNSRAGRAAIIQLALSGGEGSIPAVGLDALGAAAHQLVDDMEDQQVVADRVLLARLVLLREELRMRAEEQDAQNFFASDVVDTKYGRQPAGVADVHDDDPGTIQEQQQQQHWSSMFYGFHRANLPVRCAAFMKELLSVPERDRRLGLLSKAFEEDWVGETPTSDSTSAVNNTNATASKGLRDINHGHQMKPESWDIVRPGRFLSTLHALRAELERNCSDLSASEVASRNLDLLQQLDVVKFEALVALDRLQQSRFVSATNNTYDYELDLNRLP